MTAAAPRVRIAPSPTGDPHVGTAYTALFNRAFADVVRGTFVLRIDDTDRSRYRGESEAAIFRALRWLGIKWDEGPDRGGPCGPYRQSERTELYRAAAERLVAAGAAYRCYCSPERLARLRERAPAQGAAAGYDRRCRRLPAQEAAALRSGGCPPVIRLKVPETGATGFTDLLRGRIEVENASLDDQVLLKSDGFPTYHLANVVDDTAMRISHVIRAEEWIISTPKHVLIYRALGEQLPVFCHVPLLRNADHSKISKRKNPVSLEYYREQGFLPEALRNYLANLGWSSPNAEEVFDDEYFRSRFRLEQIRTSAPVFDLAKLRWLNGIYMRRLAPEDLIERLDGLDLLPRAADRETVRRLLSLVGPRLHQLTEFTELTAFYFEDSLSVEREQLIPRKASAAEGVRLLSAVAERLLALDPWSAERIERVLGEVRAELGLAKPQLFMPLRAALTGRSTSPPLGEVIEVLGSERACARLRVARRLLEGEAADAPRGGGPT